MAQPGISPCPIVELAPELINRIMDFVPVESHFNFATTCSFIANCSKDILQRHKAAHKTYGVSSDLSPLTIPTLLRSAFGLEDPLLVWHVRSLEIWRDRSDWKDWGFFDLNQPYCREKAEPVSWYPETGEIDKYFAVVRGFISDDILDLARSQISDGKDGFLKMLLIAMCPRLRDLKFITRAYHDTRLTSLGWFSLVIQMCFTNKTWLPGLASLHDIAIGVASCTWMDQDSRFYTHGLGSESILANILRLPQLDHVYYNGLGSIFHAENYEISANYWDHDSDESDESDNGSDISSDDEVTTGMTAYRSMWPYERYSSSGEEEETEIKYDLPPHSSSVKHIILDNVGRCSNQPFMRCLLSVAHKLESIAFRGTENLDYVDEMVYRLSCDYGDSLRSLMFYEHRESRGSRCWPYTPQDMQRFRELRHFTIDASGIEGDACNDDGGDGELFRYNDSQEDSDEENPIKEGPAYEHSDGEESSNTLSRGHFIRFFVHAFPRSMEALVLFGDGVSTLMEPRWRNIECFEDAVIALIKSKKYPNLKAIYLDQVESRTSYPWRQTGVWVPNRRTDKICFQRAVAVGIDAGVDVYTITNRNKMRHVLRFPEPLDEFDLVTGLYGGKRPDDGTWAFNAHTGRRESGCGNCGKCKACLEEYSEELWEQVDSASRIAGESVGLDKEYDGSEY
ncbi:hypothetical protein AUP68_03469 [Ilyonectria robusta]